MRQRRRSYWVFMAAMAVLCAICWQAWQIAWPGIFMQQVLLSCAIAYGCLLGMSLTGARLPHTPRLPLVSHVPRRLSQATPMYPLLHPKAPQRIAPLQLHAILQHARKHS